MFAHHYVIFDMVIYNVAYNICTFEPAFLTSYWVMALLYEYFVMWLFFDIVY